MGRKAKGPRTTVQFEDASQLAELDQAATEDQVTRNELMRRLIAYGLDARRRAREETGATDGKLGSPGRTP